MRFTSLQSVREYLDSIPKFQSRGASAANFDLSRFRNFCDAIGNPHEEFDSIHIGGTNGKGSTCNILASVFQKAGYKTGVYTSPHIIAFNERFRINGDVISNDELLEFFNTYIDDVEAYTLTYFEISTAIAFWWFARSNVDIACIEVGLGGRLDATNIIDPKISVITSISLDHTDILGDSITEIAREKAGILKEGRPVVIGDLPMQAQNEIVKIAEQKACPFYTIDNLNPKYIKTGHYQLTVDDRMINISSNLTSPIQAKNVAIVWQVCSVLGDKYGSITEENFISGLKRVNTGFGRFERLVDGEHWYFDGGHNLEAVKVLKESVKTVGNVENATLVLSLMQDKIREEVMTEFLEFKNIYYYSLGLERAATFDDIKEWLPKANPFPASDEDRKKIMQDDFDSELVIFSGSFYFYETVRDWVSTFVLNQ
ncbi:folylpolyglutamate synthase/dihydrofolate synthase family protein [Fodinibius sp.]|uniref:bifunctional folylpolyglutamate synthase/dihydrofolate synthase n=1 Tax=Fodinibius sp. TaxID=1872440 RepID=UPI002ACE5C43|nr:folylpolyglutamate synthase/dihydrofolate synthase family protein [Fodinibius sp.]MDZ7657803.1 folylpolyglutamate synthase/dihydrofolate synthase family protein [Fodinibius sp.]